ncbi:hypothetical protein GCM10020258_04370 [Sphingomonas yabuuchiae]
MRPATSDIGFRRARRRGAGDGLIGDAGRARLHQALGLRLVGGEVEIGEQHMVRAQHRDLDRLRLLDLHDHLGLLEHLGGGGDDARARIDIVLVLEIDAGAGLGLDDHLVTGGDQLGDRRRGQADAIFVVLDFLGNTDAHDELS